MCICMCEMCMHEDAGSTFFYLDVLLLWFNDFAASTYTSIYPGASGARVNSNFYIFLYLSTNNAYIHENNKVITFYIPGHGPYVFCGVSVVMAVGRAQRVGNEALISYPNCIISWYHHSPWVGNGPSTSNIFYFIFCKKKSSKSILQSY